MPARLFDCGTITVDMFGYAFYRRFRYKLVTHARVFSLKPNFKMSGRQGQFLVNSLHFLHYKFGFENMCTWEKIRDEKLLLPTKDDQIDFEFMERFIVDLEAQYIAKMEEESNTKLAAYLTVAGVKDYALTKEEEEALHRIKAVQTREYKIEQLFEEEPIRNKLSKADLSDGFQYPAYSSETKKGGLIGYASVAEFICNKDTPFHITFGDHTRVFNIAKKSFSVLDNVKVLKPYINNEKALLFIIVKWAKQIPNTGYARHWKIAKNCVLSLPTRNGEIDFKFMDKFISAIQKLVINDVALLAEKKIETARNIVNG